MPFSWSTTLPSFSESVGTALHVVPSKCSSAPRSPDAHTSLLDVPLTAKRFSLVGDAAATSFAPSSWRSVPRRPTHHASLRALDHWPLSVLPLGSGACQQKSTLHCASTAGTGFVASGAPPSFGGALPSSAGCVPASLVAASASPGRIGDVLSEVEPHAVATVASAPITTPPMRV